jgi:hypothetical protein
MPRGTHRSPAPSRASAVAALIAAIVGSVGKVKPAETKDVAR